MRTNFLKLCGRIRHTAVFICPDECRSFSVRTKKNFRKHALNTFFYCVLKRNFILNYFVKWHNKCVLLKIDWNSYAIKNNCQQKSILNLLLNHFLSVLLWTMSLTRSLLRMTHPGPDYSNWYSSIHVGWSSHE